MNQLKLAARLGGVGGILAGLLGIVVGWPGIPDLPGGFLLCIRVLYYLIVAVLIVGWICVERCTEEGECIRRCYFFTYVVWIVIIVWLLICYII